MCASCSSFPYCSALARIDECVTPAALDLLSRSFLLNVNEVLRECYMIREDSTKTFNLYIYLIAIA